MLVLTRKINQQIRLNDDITITVLRAKGNSVRIGIDAPRSVRVVRGELELHGESQAAADTPQSEEAGEALRTAEASAANHAAVEPTVYPMRLTKPLAGAPLSAFLRKTDSAPMASLANY